MEKFDLNEVTSKTPGWEFLGTAICMECKKWNGVSYWKGPDGIEYERKEYCLCDEK